MSLKASLPGYRDPIVGQGGLASRPVYNYFQAIATAVDALSDASGNVTIPELPISENANVVGATGFSIYAQGTLKTGIVRVLLAGDTQTPGNTQYYGSGPTGVRGWFNVSDALAASSNVTLTVGADGVTTPDLSAGVLASLALADSSVQPGDLATVATTGAYSDLSGLPTLGTAAATDATAYATAAQGAKADSALQSVVEGTNVTVDNTDPRNPVINVAGGSGSGDVVGPASAVDGDVALFDGTTGKLIKDGGSFGSLVRAAVLTGLSTATSAAIAATDTVLAAFGKLQAQITDNLLPKGYIDGLRLVWVSNTALTVTSGAAYIESTGKVLRATSDIAKTGLSLSASTTYHLYFYDNAGTPAVEVVTTAPASPFNGAARSKTGDSSRRYLGSFITDSSGALLPFVHTGDDFLYPAVKTSAPFRVLANGTATSPTTVDMSASVPTTATAAHLRVFNQNNVNVSLIATGFGTVTPALYSMRVQTGLIFGAPLPLGSAKSFDYALDATGSGGLYVDVTGYRVAR